MTSENIEIGELVYTAIELMDKLHIGDTQPEFGSRVHIAELSSGHLEIKEVNRKPLGLSDVVVTLNDKTVFKGEWDLTFEDEGDWIYGECNTIEYIDGTWIKELQQLKSELMTELQSKNTAAEMQRKATDAERLRKRFGN